jgi:hypothetical protein
VVLWLAQKGPALMKIKKAVILLVIGVFMVSWLSCCTNNESKYMAYYNEKAGWQVDIPVSWNGHYKVFENEDGSIDFYFCGQSEFCNSDLYSDSREGLYFFSITDNIPVSGDVIDYSNVQWLDMYYADYDPDARKKSYLGAVDGVDYYIALRTSYVYSQENDWGMGGINRLFMIDEKGSYIDRKAGKRNTLEPGEFELVKTDLSKVREMMTDLEKKVRTSFKQFES